MDLRCTQSHPGALQALRLSTAFTAFECPRDGTRGLPWLGLGDAFRPGCQGVQHVFHRSRKLPVHPGWSGPRGCPAPQPPRSTKRPRWRWRARATACKCHAVDKKKDGPSYKETAAKYKGKADAEQKLYTHLTTNPKVKIDGKEEEHTSLKTKNEPEIRNVVQWILSR
jgi:cytochrome c551/c552